MKYRNSFSKMFNVDRKVLYMIVFLTVVSIFTLTIVYAALSTTLKITGNTEVVASSWNVHFNNINVNPASVAATKIPAITDSKTIDFSVVLNKPGDFYKFNVDIVNDGSINAMIDSVIKSPDLTSEQAKYIKYEIEYINGESINTKQLLSSGETKTISVLLSYRTDITVSDLPSTPTTLNLSIELNYIQADTTSTEVTTSPKKINVNSGDLNTVGSEICIGEECFYLINNDGYNVSMLAKYNLYVGSECSSSDVCTFYGDNATGIQSEEMVGSGVGITLKKGVTPFASEEYKGTDYSDYNGSLVEKYVNDYKNYLDGHGIIISNARLITIEELVGFGCITEELSCRNSRYSWIYSTSYWSSSATSNNSLWGVHNLYGSLNVDYYGFYDDCGVRPVIEVTLTEF